MIKLTLTGYVNAVRSNETSTGKKVTNIKIAVPVGKVQDKTQYQSFDVAFWEDKADNVKGIQEKDYIIIPDVLLSKFEISEVKDKKYINISGTGNIVFKALEKEKTDSKENTAETPF